MKKLTIITLGVLGILMVFPRSSGAQWVRAHRFEMNGLECLVADGPNLYAGTSVTSFFGSGVVLQSTNNGDSWTPLNSKGWPKTQKDGRSSLTHVLSLLVNGPRIIAGTNTRGILVSADSGVTWTPSTTGLPPIGSVVCLAANRTHVFAGVYGGVLVSADNGVGWTVSTTGLPKNLVKGLATAGPNVYAGTFYGIFLSTDNGTSWRAVNSGLPQDRDILCLIVSGTDLFASVGRAGVFRSADGGTTWTPANQGLPEGSFVSGLAVSGSNVFAGTYQAGVFVSSDSGKSWKAINAGWRPEKISVKCLAVNGPHLIAGVFNDDGIKNEVWRWPLAGASGQARESAKTYFDNGVQAFRAEDFGNAILHFSKAIELDPKFVEAWFQRAWSYLKLGGKPSYDKALTDVAKVLVLSPDYKAVYFARGEIYRNKAYFSLQAGNRKEADGYLDKALADYQIALEANPNSPVIPVSIGHAHAAKGDLDSALSDYSKLLEKNPQNDEVAGWLRDLFAIYDQQNRDCHCGQFKHTWYQAGRFQLDKGHYDLAVKCFSRALDLGLDDRAVYSDRSRAYERQGDFASAIADASQVIKLLSTGYSYSARADLYQKNGELDKAIADYTKSIELERKSLKAAGGQQGTLGTFYWRRAEVFEKKQDWNRAIGDYKAATKLLVPGPSRGRAKLLYLMALVYQKKGDSKNAEKCFQQAQAMDPGLKK